MSSDVFVQAADGRFYKHPIVWGAGWWAEFGEIDDPEVIVERQPRSTPRTSKARAAKLMREAGMEIKMLAEYGQMERYFPPDMRAAQAYCFSFQLLAPIPIPNTYEAVVAEPGAVWDHCIYGFYSDLPAIDCARAVLGMDINPLILRALLAQVVYKKGKTRAEICKKLYAQVPWLRELSHDRYEEQLKGHPEIVRINWRVA